MLGELGKATGRGRDGVTFADLFHAADQGGAFHGDPTWKSLGSASPDGILIGNPSFVITIRTAGASDIASAPFTAMHEIIHGSPREGKNYTHFQMADAAYIVGGRMGLLTNLENYGMKDVTPNPNERLAKTPLEKRRINNLNSSLFQALLEKACRESK